MYIRLLLTQRGTRRSTSFALSALSHIQVTLVLKSKLGYELVAMTNIAAFLLSKARFVLSAHVMISKVCPNVHKAI